MLKQHGQQHGLQGPGVGGVHPGLEVQPGQLEEPVEMRLVLPAQRPAEFLPAAPLLLPDMAVW